MADQNCPRCGGQNVRNLVLRDYPYRGCGLDSVTLKSGVTEIRCADCGGAFHAIPRERQLLQVIALSVLWKPAPLLGAEWKYVRKACGLTQEQAQLGLGRARRGTISDWERKRPAIDLPTEIGARLFYLHSFEKRVGRPEHCFLDKIHLDQLAAMRGSFAELYVTLIGKEAQIAIEFSADEAWVPEAPKAA